MCGVQPLRVSVQVRISAAAEDFLLQLERGGGGEMARDIPVLRALLTERLTAAAEDIVGLVEERVAEYRDRVERSEREIARQRRLLDAILKPEVGLYRADVQQLVVTKEEDFPEQQQQSPRLEQEDSTSAKVKVELEEVWISQKGENPQGLDESEIIKVTLTHVAVKSEDEEEKPQLSQFLQTEENGEKRSGPESARNSSLDGRIEPGPENKPSYIFQQETENWCEDGEHQSTLFNKLSVSDTRTEADKKPFSCSDCGQKFSRKSHLKTHTTIHTGEKPFSCTECDKRFRMKGDMQTHMSVHTGEKPFSCSECNQRFSLKPNLKRHMIVHTGEKIFSCSECNQKFGLKDSLKTHMLVHTGEKTFSCPECGQKFSLKSSLKTHMTVHTGEKPFSCSECGKKFSLKISLRRHMLVHTGEKPFSCSECGQRFKQSSHLKRHVRIHTGEKPFSCSECGARFGLKYNLKTHIKIHLGSCGAEVRAVVL